IHKGPTITPLNLDAFDVNDVDDVASVFPNLNFIVEHIGLPRLEDFCWIATQEKNVYAGMSVVMPFIHARPRYFAEIMGELLFWLDEDRIIFSSDYALWEPFWIVEKFIEFELPEDIKEETGADINLSIKKKILGENIARLYDIDIDKQKEKLKNDEIAKKIGSATSGKQQTSNGLDLVLKKTAVYHKLQLVVDPELDEALTDLNFIKRIDIDDQN